MNQVARGTAMSSIGYVAAAGDASLLLRMTQREIRSKRCAVNSKHRAIREVTLNSVESQERHLIFPELH